MKSLVASTEPNDSDGDEATKRYDDEKTETDSTVSVSASSSGSFDESAKTVMMSEDDHAETGETVMALVPCKRYRGHYCFVPVRFFPNPTPEKRKVCHCISTICERQIAELV